MTKPHRRIARAALCLAVLVVAGCAGYSLVPAGTTNAKGIELTPGTTWNRFNNPRHPSHLEVWTRNGPILDMLVIMSGVEDGKPLLAMEAGEEDVPLPIFRSTMSAIDVQALFETTVAQVRRARSVDVVGLRPYAFLGGDGFRFDFAYLGGDEVDRRGTAAGTVRDGRLYMIAFEGTELLHYPTGLPDAERIIEAARFAAR